MNVIKSFELKSVLRLVVLLLAGVTGTAVAGIPVNGPYPFTAPGIGASSYPAFLDQGETITVSEVSTSAGSYWNMTGIGATTSFLGSPSNAISLGSGDSVEYQANFNLAGQLITSIGATQLANFLTISGALPAGSIGSTSWTAQPNQLLLSATLSGINNVDSPDAIGVYNNAALGFKTTFTGGWVLNYPGLTGGSLDENLWLFSQTTNSSFNNLIDALNGNGVLTAATIDNVSAVAAVPAPGAVWLFSAGFGFLAFNSRKLKSRV
jgi:hypothetical protein